MSPDTDAEWYVNFEQSGPRGPMTEQDVRQLITVGKLISTSQCRHERMTDWVELKEVPLFHSAFREQAPDEEAPASAFEEGLRAIRNTFRIGARETARKAELAKLHVQLMKLERERKSLCSVLGDKVYAKRESFEEDPQLAPHVKAIAHCDKDIAELQHEIDGVNAQEPE
jgi:hypothetical protein